MTPEQRAVLAVQEAGGYTDEVPVIAEAIRAALRERDAEWREALKAAHKSGASYISALAYPDADNEPALRALLEEAGK